MFRNSVFRPSVSTKKWFKATIIRCIKTMSQVLLAEIGTAVVMKDVNWAYALSATLLSGLCCILMSLTGLPEVSPDDEDDEPIEPKYVEISDDDV